MEIILNNVLAIIRGANERTEALCIQLIKKEIPSNRVIVVKEQPFSAALKRSYAIGIDYNLKWTLCVDADVLIRPNTIQRYLIEAEKLKKNYFGLQGTLLDKFYGNKKFRCPHLYRTNLLKVAIKEIDLKENLLRPEAKIKQIMDSKGYNWEYSESINGIHDFEQYYCDIFRKMAARAQKSEIHCDKLFKRAMFLSNYDNDFRVAAWGINFGMTLTSANITFPSKQWKDVIKNLLICNNLNEKKPLDPNNVSSDLVQSILSNKGPINLGKKETSYKDFIKSPNLIVWETGQFFLKIGSYLQRLVVS